MGVKETIRNRTQKAKVFENAPDVQAGAVYEWLIKKVKGTEGKDAAGNDAIWFVAEFEISAMTPTLPPETIAALPAGKRPNAAGSTAALKLNILKDWAAGVEVSFLTALLNESAEELGKEFCAVACEASTAGKKCDHKTSALIDVLLDEDENPCAGLRIKVEAYEKGLRGKPATPENMRTRFRFTHIPGQDHPLFKD